MCHSAEATFCSLLHHEGFLLHDPSITQTPFTRRLQAIEKERSPQVLAIQHSDEEDESEDHSEDEHPRSVENDNTDKKEEAHNDDSKATCSADSSLGSLSPGELAPQTHSLLLMLKFRQGQ